MGILIYGERSESSCLSQFEHGDVKIHKNLHSKIYTYVIFKFHRCKSKTYLKNQTQNNKKGTQRPNRLNSDPTEINGIFTSDFVNW